MYCKVPFTAFLFLADGKRIRQLKESFMNILFLGGDRRMTVAYEILKEKYGVSSLGLFEDDTGDVGLADVIILPVPATRDNVNVNAPLTGRVIPLDILKSVKRGTVILTYGLDVGRYPQIDYSKIDSFCIKNAISTAEGAIAFAVNNTDFTLFGSKILITGFGRVGKVLLSRLKPFSGDITVSARKDADFALLEATNIKSIKTADAYKVCSDFDIIFNTLDLELFDSKALKSTYLFDLSTKGCVKDVKQSTGHIYKLPGIPGKTAPLSAGRIIADTVNEIIETL